MGKYVVTIILVASGAQALGLCEQALGLCEQALSLCEQALSLCEQALGLCEALRKSSAMLFFDVCEVRGRNQ